VDRGARYLLLTESFKPLPALNLGCFDAGMLIFSPVRGLRPSEARRWLTLNVPKPTRRTSPPPLKASVIASNTLSTAPVLSALDKPALSATTATRSFLFTLNPPPKNLNTGVWKLGMPL